MMIDIAISTAPYLVPFAAGILVTSVAGLRRARKAVVPVPLRVEPELPELPAPPPVAVVEPAVEHVSDLPEIRRRMTPRLIVSQARAAEILIEFMASEGQSGYFTSKEIDEWWAFTSAARDIERINAADVREALDSRGLRVGQKRLNAPEYLAVRQRTGQTRPVLYRIPRIRTQAASLPDDPEVPQHVRKPSNPLSGKKPDGLQTASQLEAA